MQIRTWLAGLLLAVAAVTDAPSIQGNAHEPQPGGAPRSRPRNAPTSPIAANQANPGSRAGTRTIQGAVHRVRRHPANARQRERPRGSTTATGGLALTIHACARAATPGSALVLDDPAGIVGIRVASGTRVLNTVSHVFDGLARGTCQVGMCGYIYDASRANSWNDNGLGYATAFVLPVTHVSADGRRRRGHHGRAARRGRMRAQLVIRYPVQGTCVLTS